MVDTAADLDLDTIDSSAFSHSKDADVSVDFGKISSCEWLGVYTVVTSCCCFCLFFKLT